MQGVRALCDKYGIMLIMDEVMVGFGRTGKFWAFQHYDGVLPDIFTSAKGLSGAWQPIAVVGARQEIRDFFENNALGWGATFHAHPVAMACAYEVMKHFVKEDILGHVNNVLAPVMHEEIAKLVDRHSSVRQGRHLGMFGCLDLVGEDGNYVQPVGAASPPKVAAFKDALLENGIIGFVRPPFLHCAPALVIEEGDLREGYARVSRALEVLDF